MAASTLGAARRSRILVIPRVTSTIAPGRAATKAKRPYATAIVRPWLALSPAAPNAQAVTPSRGPQPPTLTGRLLASRASAISGARRSSDAGAPAGRAAD